MPARAEELLHSLRKADQTTVPVQCINRWTWLSSCNYAWYQHDINHYNHVILMLQCYLVTPPLPGPKSRMWKEEGCACGQHPNHVRKQLLQKPTQRKNTSTVRGGTSQETEEMKGGSQTRMGADISMADLLTPKYKIRWAHPAAPRDLSCAYVLWHVIVCIKHLTCPATKTTRA